MKTTVGNLGISRRVQKGLEALHAGRSQREEFWGEGLTVLDEETARLPLVKRKAIAEKKILCEMPVIIREHELIVGRALLVNAESVAEGMPQFPEYATDEEKHSAMELFVGPRSVFGHFCPDYARYLRLGLGGLKKLANGKLADVEKKGELGKKAWYESVIISLDALDQMMRRYSDLALQMADRETDAARRLELREISRISTYLIDNPPRTFREALQGVWFAHVAFHSTLNILALGRLDQFLWPYLRHDLENNRITLDKAQELVDLFWLKCSERLKKFELNRTPNLQKSPSTKNDMANKIGQWSLCLGGNTSHDRFRLDGGTYTQFLQTVTLSGLTPEGSDGTNPLTYLCLNAVLRLNTPQPCTYVRFHDHSPKELYDKVAECLRAGCVGPGIYNDEIIVPGFQKWGISLKDARDYTSDGCFETYVQGKTYFKYGVVSLAECLDRVLCPANWWAGKASDPYLESLDPYKDSKPLDPYDIQSFNDVLEAVKENLDRYVEGFIKVVEKMHDGRLYTIAPLPLLSAFVEGPLEQGKDITLEGMEYTQHSPLLVGLSHVADSLAVIKKLCFEEKVVSWPDLVDAVRTNWQGKEYLRQLVMTRAPAYGNDLDYVDDIARELVEYFVGSVRKYSTKSGSDIKFLPCIGTFELYIAFGLLIGATPDGRLAGDPLGTNASPSIGRPIAGHLAALNSYLKLPLIDVPVGAPLDLNMERSEGILSQLDSLMKCFVKGGGNLLTVTVHDCSELREAQETPEKYRDLIVRAGGHQAYFVDLPVHHQIQLIRRCEQYGGG